MGSPAEILSKQKAELFKKRAPTLLKKYHQSTLDNSLLTKIFRYTFTPQSHSISPLSVCKQWSFILSQTSFWNDQLDYFYPNFPFQKMDEHLNKQKNYSRAVFIIISKCLDISTVYETEELKQEQVFAAAKAIEGQGKINKVLDEEILHRTMMLLKIIPTREYFYGSQFLIYGPKGCGKTKYVLDSTKKWGAKLITINCVEMQKISSNYKTPNTILSYAWDIAEKSPRCVIHLSDVDGEYNIFRSGLISYLDAINKVHVWIIGTTSDPNSVDPSIGRRLRASVYVGIPTAEEKTVFLQQKLQDDTLDISKIIEHSPQDFSYSDLISVIDSVKAQKKEVTEGLLISELHNHKPQNTSEKIYKLSKFDPQVLNERYMLGWSSFDRSPWMWDKDGIPLKDEKEPQGLQEKYPQPEEDIYDDDDNLL